MRGRRRRAARADTAYSGPRRALLEIGLPRRVPAALDSIPHPWPGVAMLLAAAGTALPVAAAGAANARDHDLGRTLGWAAVGVVTPSAGHLYAGLHRRALKAMVFRAALLGGIALASNGFDDGEFTEADLVGLGLMSAFAASAAWDVVTVAADVERHNAALLARRAAWGPRPLPSGRGVALAVSVGF